MYRSYTFTVRPTKGVTKETEIRLIKWLKKQDYGYATIEMTDEARHLHGQIWLDVGRARGVVNKSIRLICEETIPDWNSAQAKVLSNGTKIAYDDFYTSYLLDSEKKLSDKKNVVFEKVPDRTTEYYPTEEEQNRVKSECNAVDKRYHKLNEMYLNWDKYELDDTLYNVSIFVNDMMFKKKTIAVIQDSRVCRQMVKGLHAYNRGSMDLLHFMSKSDFEEVKLKKEIEEMTNSYD